MERTVRRGGSVAAPETSPAGFRSALDGIVQGLRRHPPLLYGLGGGILLIGLVGAVGGIASDQLWLLVGALVVLVLAGLGAWLVARPRPETPRGPRVTAGHDISTRAGGKVAESDDREWAPVIKAGGSITAEGEGSSIGSLRSTVEPAPPSDQER